MLSAVALPNLPGPPGVSPSSLPLQQCHAPPPGREGPAVPFSFAFFARWSVHRTIMMRVHFLEVPYLMMRRRHLDAPEPGVYDGRRGVDRP